MQTRDTTSFLLAALHASGNDEGWSELDGRYRPILTAFARRLGLDEADAADAAQEALTRFLTLFRQGRFDPQKGALRSWITGIARNCVREIRDQRVRRREQRGLSALAELPGDEGLTRVWDEECDRHLVHRALAELRTESRADPKTVRAFELLAFEQRSPGDVAALMGMTRNDVYLAKHRCLVRLRDILETIRAAYEIP
jgi:RNA polymerase sigma-70 factor (ECF subfamily)